MKHYHTQKSAIIDKKSRISGKVYLGTVEKIAKAKLSQLEDISSSGITEVLDFGAVAAIYDIAERLEIRSIIDEEMKKRRRAKIGEKVVLAAIGKALETDNKKISHSNWLAGTVLNSGYPLKNGDYFWGQEYLNPLPFIGDEAIKNIQNKITSNIINRFDVPAEYLLIDTAEIITYIDPDDIPLIETEYSSLSDMSGKKENLESYRNMIGLSLLVSPENNIPFSYEIYTGKVKYYKKISEIKDHLKNIFQKIPKDIDLTLVIERGDKTSIDIEEILEILPKGFHFLTTLNHFKNEFILETPIKDFKSVKGDNVNKIKAYRTTKSEFGKRVAVMMTFNPDLFRAQMRENIKKIQNCEIELNKLKSFLEGNEEGRTTGEEPQTYGSIEAKINNILTDVNMRYIFEYKINTTDGDIRIEYSVNEEKLDYIKRYILGRNLLCTDRLDWSNEKIVNVYESWYRSEENYNHMKKINDSMNMDMWDFDYENVSNYTFISVLALTLRNILKLEFKRLGYNESIDKILKELNDVKQVINYQISGILRYSKTYTFTEKDGIIKDYIQIRNLDKYAVK